VVLEARDSDDPVDPRYIGIDPVGVGASTVNKVRELGLKVRHLSGGTKAVPGLDTDLMWSEVNPDLDGNLKPAGPTIVEAERFDNLRSQIWWRLREDLRQDRIALPNDDELWLDLTTPTFTTRNGKICVEQKEQIQIRLGRSPNKGDAVAYANFVRRRTWLPKPGKPVPQEPKRNVDRGLERLVVLNQRRMKAEEVRFKRRFAARKRGSR